MSSRSSIICARAALVVVAAVLGLAAGPARAAVMTLTWDITPGAIGPGDNLITGGAGTWNTTNGNWTTDAGANNIVWDNTSPSLNTAVLNAAGIGGSRTVTVDEAINLKTLSLTNLSNTNRYTIAGSTLNFAAGGSITAANTNAGNYVDYATITSAITGAPNVVPGFSAFNGWNNQLAFAPASGSSQALGTMSGAGIIRLTGNTTGNSLVGCSSTTAKLKMSSGEWTLTGTYYAYEVWLEGGNFIVSTGTLRHEKRAISLIGGTLHYNNPAAVRSGVANGGDGSWRLRGGSLDNTSGAAITTSTWNPGMNWETNWTFIGSKGAASDLYLGNGNVFLGNATKQVTVQNAATTLAVGGVLSNGGLTKAGDGTLELRGASSYTGATTVNAGTLLINGSTAAGSAVTVNTGGTLGGIGTVAGDVNVFGTLAPGASIESIDTGNLSIGETGTLDIELGRDGVNPVSDIANVTGAVTLASGANLKLTLYSGLDNPVLDDIFYLVANDDADAVTGVFTKLNGVATTLNQDSTFTWNSQLWKISYTADTVGVEFTGGNDVAIKVVPEPATMGLLAIGGLLALRRRRRA